MVLIKVRLMLLLLPACLCLVLEGQLQEHGVSLSQDEIQLGRNLPTPFQRVNVSVHIWGVGVCTSGTDNTTWQTCAGKPQPDGFLQELR